MLDIDLLSVDLVAPYAVLIVGAVLLVPPLRHLAWMLLKALVGLVVTVWLLVEFMGGTGDD